MSSNDIAISVKNVHKEFVLNKEQGRTLKKQFISIFKPSNRHYEKKQNVLDGISFEVKKGEFFAIVGRNGSGKSTLLKIVSEIYQPSSGTVEINGKLVSFIELGVGFNPELSGRDNVFLNGALLGRSRKQIEIDYDKIVEFAELQDHMDKKLKNYSSGMQVRLAFACATVVDSEILIIDEVLAVGDQAFQKKCFMHFKNLKAAGKTMILVTHDMSAVKEYCDTGILVEKGKIVADGNIKNITSKYNKMFNPQYTKGEQILRWGSKELEIESAHIDTIQNDEIRIKMNIVCNHATNDEVLLAYAIKNSEGSMLFGNKHRYKLHMNSDDKKSITFIIENILNKGEYLVDLSIFSIHDKKYYDCWVDISKFTSEKNGVDGYSIIVNDKIS